MPTKWLDCTDSTLVNWADTTTPFLASCWEQIKGSADERVAFRYLEHDSNFPADYVNVTLVVINKVFP